jgi:hypothetical protein
MGEQVIKCATDGLSQTVQDDCGAKGQVCVAAMCVTGVCTPGKRYCSGNEARQCSVKGDSYTTVQVCQPTEYCDTATGACKTKVCTANMPACNGRISTTCNTDGSGYVAGGTDCSPKYCSAGACVDYLFHEDFEDGDLVGWTNGAGTYTTRAVVNTLGAAGTTSSLYLAKTSGLSGYADGVYQTFASVLTPSSISWYVRVPTNPGYEYAGIVNLWSTTAQTNLLFRAYINYTPYIYIYDYSGTSLIKLATINTWYHFELRNINWTNRTYDFYLDGVLQLTAGRTFASSGNGVQRIDLSGYYTGDNAYFDQIDFLP